jgi:hypothetical protein
VHSPDVGADDYSAVLRSVVEAYADLRAMLKDADHGQHIPATFEAEKRRHLKSMIESSGNPYHSGAIGSARELPKVEGKIKRLAKLGHRPLFIV